MNCVSQWLATSGAQRRTAAKLAAGTLLARYRDRWRTIVPPELHRLAASLGSTISRVKEVEGGARLLPVRGGFQILVSTDLHMAKYRMAVAHELAHTLFYSKDEEIPKRLFGPSRREEDFCFDVGRRILAPEWLISDLQRYGLLDPEELFDCLTGKLKLSKPIAARVMLEDYELVVGVAGRWSRNEAEWKLERGGAYASPCLGRKERKSLHELARRWLETNIAPLGPYQIVSRVHPPGEAAFVCVVRQSGQKDPIDARAYE